MAGNIASYLLVFSLLFHAEGFSSKFSQKSLSVYKEKSRLAIQEGFELIENKSTILNAHQERSTLKILLPNGLKVFLISDPNAKEAAASLAVEAGTWDDPDEYPGMAHFVEHLLFLGTEQYPDESDYSKYILERGGQYNAFTRQDRTIYGFSIQPNGFKGALDRLSCFFINPLFTSSAIERERHAVHHEFEDSIENDSVRVWRVLKETGNVDHPNFNFSCGNLESLSPIERKDILKWFKTYYQPQKMKLVLMSSDSLEVLAKYASHFFSRIPKPEEIETYRKKGYEQNLLSPKQKGHLICIKPAFRNRTLSLIWEVPPAFLECESSRGMHLLQIALDHGYSNSLSKVLEKESLAKELHVDFWKVEKTHALFMLQVLLTSEGVKRYEEVISYCYQAIRSLKEIGIPEYLIDQLGYSELNQLTPEFINSFDFMMRISSEMIDEEIETYPDKTYLISPFASATAHSFLSELTPFECAYFLTAPPEEVGVHLSRIEKWMGSEYVIRTISSEKLHDLETIGPHESIGIPPEEKQKTSGKDNTLIESEAPLYEPPDPVFIIDNEMARIRLVEGNGDTVEAFFCFSSPFIGTSAKRNALNELFVRNVKNYLRQTFNERDLLWDLEIEGADLCLFLSANKNSYEEVFSEVFKALKNRILSPLEFEKLKKRRLDSYPGDPQPIDYAHQILDSFLKPFVYTEMELYHSLEHLKYEEYEEFQSSYFTEIFIEGAFLGFADQNMALDLWRIITDSLELEKANPYKERTKKFLFQEEKQSYFVLQKTHRKGNALILLVDGGQADEENWLMHKILSLVLQNEFFEELRTRQQTSYKVYSWNERMDQRICHCFGLQSSTHHPLDLLRRVEEFVDGFSMQAPFLLGRERFELIRSTFLFNLEKRKSQLDKIEDIELALEQVNSLKKLTYEKILEEISRIFSKENRRRIAILVEGSHPLVTTSYDSIVPYLRIEKESFYR